MTVILIDDELIEKGHAYIDPYSSKKGIEPRVPRFSYPLGLGKYYSRAAGPAFKPGTDLSTIAPSVDHPATVPHLAEWINLDSKSHAETMWQVYEARRVKELHDQYPDESYAGLDVETDSAIVLQPGETIISHTEENVGASPLLIPVVSPHRYCVHRLLKVGIYSLHPGVADHVTFTIQNLNQHQRVLLPVGIPIVNVSFHNTNLVEIAPGKWQDFKKDWDPSKKLVPR